MSQIHSVQYEASREAFDRLERIDEMFKEFDYVTVDSEQNPDNPNQVSFTVHIPYSTQNELNGFGRFYRRSNRKLPELNSIFRNLAHAVDIVEYRVNPQAYMASYEVPAHKQESGVEVLIASLGTFFSAIIPQSFASSSNM